MAVKGVPRVWVACYDVRDDRRRSKIQHLLERYGWRHQLSVFVIVADAEQARRATDEASELLEPWDRLMVAALDEGVPGWVVGYPLEAAANRLAAPLVRVVSG